MPDQAMTNANIPTMPWTLILQRDHTIILFQFHVASVIYFT